MPFILILNLYPNLPLCFDSCGGAVMGRRAESARGRRTWIGRIVLILAVSFVLGSSASVFAQQENGFTDEDFKKTRRLVLMK